VNVIYDILIVGLILEVACWMHTGERQAAKMRMAYLKSMLNQDISLFDTEASTGEVISAITSDIIIVQDALSEKVHTLNSPFI
jgi:ATP-binding cassette subfamily B (MDR/TAP) protein 1